MVKLIGNSHRISNQYATDIKLSHFNMEIPQYENKNHESPKPKK